MLTSGRRKHALGSILEKKKSALGDSVHRGEVVTIMLSGTALEAWKWAGNQWKAWT